MYVPSSRWDEQNSLLVESHERVIAELTEEYEAKLAEEVLKLEALKQEKEALEREAAEVGAGQLGALAGPALELLARCFNFCPWLIRRRC